MKTSRAIESALQQRVLRVYNNVGCLMVVDGDGRCAHAGTVTLVRLGDQKLLLTADHVVAGISAHGGPIRVGIASSAPAAVLVEFEYRPQVVWRSALLDAALLSCPRELVDKRDAGWFDVASHASMTTKVRGERIKHDTATTSLPYFIAGIPKFSRMTFEPERVEVLGVVTLPAYVTQLDSAPWAGERSKAPQMHLELDIDTPNPTFKPDDRLGAMMFDQAAKTLFETGAEFGGLSGGPVLLVDGSGEFLMGIVKQGAVIFGNKVVVASALDDIVATPDFPDS
jgi:hypothetical protein